MHRLELRDVVLEFSDPFSSSTACTAKVVITRLHAVTYDLGSTGLTNRGQHSNGAFKAVKGIGLIVGDDFKSFVVGVSTFVTSFHELLLGFKKNDLRSVDDKVSVNQS